MSLAPRSAFRIWVGAVWQQDDEAADLVQAISFRTGIGQWLRFIPGTGTLGKNDKLSFLRVCLSQMDKVPGGTNGYARSLRARGQVSYGSFILNLQQRVIRQASLACRQTARFANRTQRIRMDVPYVPRFPG